MQFLVAGIQLVAFLVGASGSQSIRLAVSIQFREFSQPNSQEESYSGTCGFVFCATTSLNQTGCREQSLRF